MFDVSSNFHYGVAFLLVNTVLYFIEYLKSGGGGGGGVPWVFPISTFLAFFGVAVQFLTVL